MKRLIGAWLTLVMLLALNGCQSNKATEATVETTPVASVKTATAEGVEMDYIVFGSGEKSFIILPGLAIHSVMGSADAIAAAYADFTDDYTVYVFDRAKDLREGYGIRDMAADSAAIMRSLGIESADVFGASQGGMIAQYLAIDHPELVHKLILGSTLSKPNEVCRQNLATWVALAEAKDERALLESFVDTVYSETTLEAYRETMISANLGISDEEYERFLLMAASCEDFDCYDELSAIQCPVLVIGSEGDRVVTPEASRQIAEALGCELYMYDASYGHGVYDEAPDYKQRCLDFLED